MSGKNGWSVWRRPLLVLISVILIIGAFSFGIWMGKKSMGTKEIVKNLTDNWQEFKSDKYGFSFKYPSDWQVTEDKETGAIKISNQRVAESLINIRVLGERTIDSQEPADAIQISIPFGKRDFVNLSTSTGNEAREIFYAIPMTLGD